MNMQPAHEERPEHISVEFDLSTNRSRKQRAAVQKPAITVLLRKLVRMALNKFSPGDSEIPLGDYGTRTLRGHKPLAILLKE